MSRRCPSRSSSRWSTTRSPTRASSSSRRTGKALEPPRAPKPERGRTREARSMAATEEILGQFLGDQTFPVAWDSESEKDLFWVYDDLHIPHPVSPMFFDIGGWWLSCDHMFRRFGTPFAVDWLAKKVNGYVYTAAVPADTDLHVEGTEYSSRYQARVPRDANFQATMGAYLDIVLPVYGRDFADWWRNRLRPEMERNFAYLEARLD